MPGGPLSEPIRNQIWPALDPTGYWFGLLIHQWHAPEALAVRVSVALCATLFPSIHHFPLFFLAPLPGLTLLRTSRLHLNKSQSTIGFLPLFLDPST